MKFTINAKTFAALLANLNKVIATRNTLLILDNFRITLTDGSVTIIASDVETTAFAGLTAVSSEGNGTFCINARKLTSLAKSIGDQPMTLECADNEAVINTASGHYTLPTFRGEDYPLPQAVEGMQVTLVSSQFIHALDKTAWAASTEEIRPQMNGVCLDLQPDQLTLCATDTRKLCAYTLPLSCETPTTVILPSKAARLAAVLLPDTDAFVDIVIGKTAISFTSSDISITSALVKGTFPPYGRVIPPDAASQVSVSRTGMQCALSRISAFSDLSSRLVFIKADADTLRLTASDLANGTDAAETLPCGYSGTPLAIGFHGEYLAQLLANLSCEDMQMQITDPTRPMKIAETDDYGHFTAILMPMSLPSE